MLILYAEKTTTTCKDCKCLVRGKLSISEIRIYVFFEYYEGMIPVGAWSNQTKPDGLYDNFDYALTELSPHNIHQMIPYY